MSALAQLLSFLTFVPVANSSSPYIRSIQLPTSQIHTEPVSCIYYQSRFFITGTDIIRALLFRFRVLNISIGSLKKFEEGIFSDLRNLKVGAGCQLEEPRSPFLVQLHELGCIRTQKKQKVFFWECVNHEYLFQEALGRERKRQVGVNGQEVMLMDGAEWQSMIGLWEAHIPLKVTVSPLALPNVEPKWSTDGVDPALLHAASPLKAPLMRVTNASKGWMMGHSRSSSASSSIFSRPGTPMVGPSTPSNNFGSALPVSMHHLLNQGNNTGTPSLWDDEAIAAVTFEVLKNSPELFTTTITEPDLMLDYSNWLASVSNTPSDSLLSSDAQSVYSALSMLEESAIQQLDASNSLFDGIDFDQQEYDIAAANLLFTNLINTSDAASKKRERSSTTTSSKSAKRFQPYNLVKGH